MRAEAGIPRRRVLLGLVLLPPALVGCARAGSARPVDPLVALADAARADAALGTAAIAADAALAERVQPLVDARTAHAAALDAEVRRLRPNQGPATAAPPVTGPPTVAAVRSAARAAADAAAEVALDLPVDRVGLVASVAACCASYATVLT